MAGTAPAQSFRTTNPGVQLRQDKVAAKRRSNGQTIRMPNVNNDNDFQKQNTLSLHEAKDSQSEEYEHSAPELYATRQSLGDQYDGAEESGNLDDNYDNDEEDDEDSENGTSESTLTRIRNGIKIAREEMEEKIRERAKEEVKELFKKALKSGISGTGSAIDEDEFLQIMGTVSVSYSVILLFYSFFIGGVPEGMQKKFKKMGLVPLRTDSFIDWFIVFTIIIQIIHWIIMMIILLAPIGL